MKAIIIQNLGHIRSGSTMSSYVVNANVMAPHGFCLFLVHINRSEWFLLISYTNLAMPIAVGCL